MGSSLFIVLKEALQAFPKVGQSIADAISFEEWQGSKEDHENIFKKTITGG